MFQSNKVFDPSHEPNYNAIVTPGSVFGVFMIYVIARAMKAAKVL